MNLLFISKTDNAKDWEAALLKEVPGLNFLVWPEESEPRERIDYILAWNPPIGEIKKFPNLKAILSLGAGVDGVLNDPHLPINVPIIRLVDPLLTRGMTEYIIYWTLFHHRRMGDYSNSIKKQIWKHFPQPDTTLKKVGILGAGKLGSDAARKLKLLHFDVAVWSKSPKNIKNITCYNNKSGFGKILQHSSILICLLPLTGETKSILNEEAFKKMPRSSVIINCARGGHLVEADLLSAIESGQISAATLDVFNEEPLPKSHPFWNHKRIFLTPHMASLTVPKSAARNISKSISLIESGLAPLNVINLTKGY